MNDFGLHLSVRYRSCPRPATSSDVYHRVRVAMIYMATFWRTSKIALARGIFILCLLVGRHAAVKKKSENEIEDHPIWTLLVLGQYGAVGGTVSI